MKESRAEREERLLKQEKIKANQNLLDAQKQLRICESEVKRLSIARKLLSENPEQYFKEIDEINEK